MRQVKRRVPAITLPEMKAFSYALVLARNPHREHFTPILRIMDFTIPVMKVGTKDKPHASLSLLRIKKSTHIFQGLKSLICHQQACCLVTTKNPERRSLGSLFLLAIIRCWRGKDFPLKIWTFLIRTAKII